MYFRFIVVFLFVAFLPAQANNVELFQGKFLIATRSMTDPRFTESVVLLIRYDRDGAFGLIINIPTKMTAAKALPEFKGKERAADFIHIGGPVGVNQLFLLARTGDPPEDSLHIFGDVYICSNKTVMQDLIDSKDKKEKVRFYLGYAGWAAGQLDAEMLTGHWSILPADEESIFDKTPSEVWPELHRRTLMQQANRIRDEG